MTDAELENLVMGVTRQIGYNGKGPKHTKLLIDAFMAELPQKGASAAQITWADSEINGIVVTASRRLFLLATRSPVGANHVKCAEDLLNVVGKNWRSLELDTATVECLRQKGIALD